MSDILFIKTSSLGDVIHHMPALTEARLHRPHARFAWLVEEAYAPLVALHPGVSEVIPVATRRWRNALVSPATWREMSEGARAIRARAYDEVIDAQGLVRTGVMARVARGRRHGYDATSIRERAASMFYDLRHAIARDLHAIARNRLLTALALGYAVEGPPDFGLDRAALAGRTSSQRYGVLLHATARREKEWPQASWIALGQALAPRGAALVLPWGSAGERTRSERIAGSLNDARVEAHVPPREPLDRVARLIAGADFVIGVDTGLLHLAAALGVPLVAIFCGSVPGLTGPLGPGPIAVAGGKGEPPSVADVIAALERVRPAAI